MNIIMKVILMVTLIGCTMTEICVHNENGSTCTVDTSTSANPVVDPTVSVPKL